MLLVNAGIILAFFLSLGLFGVWLIPIVIAELHLLLEPQAAERPAWNIFAYLFIKKRLKNIEDEELDIARPKELPLSNDVDKTSTNQFPVFLFVFILLISSAIMFAVDSWLGLLVSLPLISLILFQRASSYN